ncbi:hypothetical protein T06_16776 [Trichinella sp. T6]|nr:hypothetical protein T06_16776 [Trichinella sp. T6]
MLLTAHDRGDGRVVDCEEVSRPATRPDQRQISLLKSIAQAQKRYNRERWWLTERTREKKTRYREKLGTSKRSANSNDNSALDALS